MRQSSLLLLWLSVMTGTVNLSCSNRHIVVSELTCEYRHVPLGIDQLKPRLGWILEGDQRGQKQTAYQVLVASKQDILAKDQGDLWNSGKVNSEQSIHVEYDGAPLKSGQRCFWKLRVWDKDGKPSEWSNNSTWEMALLGKEEWKGAWIYDGKPTPEDEETLYLDDPNPLLRKEFELSKPIASARLYITGLGYYESYLNGHHIGDQVLDPGFTDYSKRVFYSTFDVTSLLKEGNNCIGIMLGNGWYNPLPMRMWGWLNLRDHLTIGRPRAICQLNVQYTDGSQDRVVTDQSWKVGEGPVIRNNIYLGEVYDARFEQPGWNKPGFVDTAWRSAAYNH